MLRTTALASGLALVGALVFGIVYGAERADSTPTVEIDTHPNLAAAATLLSAHADVMREHGERLIETGDARWVDLGETHQTEAGDLEAAAEELSRACRDLILFPEDHGVRLERVRANIRAINQSGQMLLVHARDMERLAEDISFDPADPNAELLSVFREHLNAEVDSMTRQGRALLTIDQRLTERTDRLERSLAR